MAAIGVALWKYVMRYAPHTPDYFNRDRFVLSNGMHHRINLVFRIKTNQEKVIHVSFSTHSSISQDTKL